MDKSGRCGSIPNAPTEITDPDPLPEWTSSSFP
jgi:hypothetical protein